MNTNRIEVYMPVKVVKRNILIVRPVLKSKSPSPFPLPVPHVILGSVIIATFFNDALINAITGFQICDFRFP